MERLLTPLGDSIDAVVTSTNLETGELSVWRDSASINATGQTDHVFWSEFRPGFGTHHRMRVKRSDGAATFVSVEIPVEVSIDQEDTGTRYLHAHVRGGDVRLIRADIIYSLRHNPNPCLTPQGEFSVSYTGEEIQTENGWRIEINLGIHYDRLRSRYHNRFPEVAHPKCIGACEEEPGLAFMGMVVSLTVGSDMWDPPGETFNDRILVHPGTLSNVENGFGFVGGGYNKSASLFPSSVSISDTWFHDYLMRPPSDCYDYCSCGQL